MAVTNSIRQCRRCGVEFRRTAKGQPTKYCSEACRGAAPGRRPQAAECITCGASYFPSYRAAGFCSVACRRAPAFIGPRNKKKSRPPLREVSCCGCGITTMRRMRGDESGRYCSRACDTGSMTRVAAEKAALLRIQRAWAWRPSAVVMAEVQALRRIRRNKERQIRTERGCGTCGVPVAGLLNWPRTCAPCKDMAERRARRIARAARDKRIRSRPRDRIDPFAVFERDGWRCYMCGIATPQVLRGTCEPSAPELEHKVALANGGTHTWDNVACSCRACNGAKGARLAA